MSAPVAPRRRRTFSAFGEVRKMPSEYEIVTHGQNWTMRANRAAPFEQNPSSVPNLWLKCDRDNSPLRADDWEGFRDPDALTYRAYVNMQSLAEARVQGALEAHAERPITPKWADVLGRVFSPSRYLFHGFQQIEAYVGYMAPSSYITNAAAFATADFLRRVTIVAYRTRELQLAFPGSGIGSRERERFEREPGWQPARCAVENALVAYDWGEAFTALNLVLAPAIERVLLGTFKEAARAAGDELGWLLAAFLQEDADRRARWSQALSAYAIERNPNNQAVLARWIERWTPAADEAAAGLASLQ